MRVTVEHGGQVAVYECDAAVVQVAQIGLERIASDGVVAWEGVCDERVLARLAVAAAARVERALDDDACRLGLACQRAANGDGAGTAGEGGEGPRQEPMTGPFAFGM